MSTEPLYTNYYNCVSDTLEYFKIHNTFNSFKSDPKYQEVLEHVPPELGSKLLNLCRTEFNVSDSEMEHFIQQNNRFGDPIITSIDGWSYSNASPSNFRYIYHAHLILEHLSKLNIRELDIVEIGGGYGGLALALSIYADKFNIKIYKYHFIDLPNSVMLQKIYMSHYNHSFLVESHNADTFGGNIIKTNKPLYLISCYALTEIERAYQEKYLTTLIPKINHGFIINNGKGALNPSELNKNIMIEEERPSDIHKNTFWFF